MTKDEFIKQVEAMKERHKIELSDFCINYSKVNKRFNFGDIVEDLRVRIQVDQIEYLKTNIYNTGFEVVYRGFIITKKGTRRKKRDYVYESNVKE